MSEESKYICRSCGGHIAYDEQSAGQTVQCPHCGRDATLDEASGSVGANSVPRRRTLVRSITLLTLLLLIATAVGVGLRIAATRKAEKQRNDQESLVRAGIEVERLKAEAEKAKAEAENARLKAEELAKANAAKAAAEREAAAKRATANAAAAEAAKLQEEENARLEEVRKTTAKRNPAILALWEEPDHDAIRIVTTRDNGVTVNHKGVSVSANYQDLPKWLVTAGRAKHKEDGEAKGVIREVDGKLHDLRASPVGWLNLPTAEVIQIVEDGYLLIDVKSLKDPYAQTKVFKLKHNGLTRILNTGDRIQVMAKSVGTHTYLTKSGEALTVPVYDPGMPVGPLREKVVTMEGRPATGSKGAPSPDEPFGNGSGFFISEDGLFISNAHVVADSTRIEVKTAAGTKRATVLQTDKDKDLALLRVSIEKGSVSALSISTNVATLGAQVFTIGYPMVELQGSRPKFTDGRVSSLAGIRDDPDQMQISVPVQPGNSGGPLTDMNGDIVGVVVGRMNDLKVIKIAGSVPQNVNYAVKGTTLLQFLKANKALLPNLKLGGTQRRTQEEAIQLVEKASGLVLSYR